MRSRSTSPAVVYRLVIFVIFASLPEVDFILAVLLCIEFIKTAYCDILVTVSDYHIKFRS